MEKSGRRNGGIRGGRLLRRLCSLLLLGVLCLQPLMALEVDISVSAFEVSAGDSVIVSFTVHNTDPSATVIDDFPVPPSFAPASARKERSQLKTSGVFAGSSESATVITREWIPSLAGSFTLGPFTVTAGGDSVILPPVYLTVIPPPVSRFTALRWSTSSSGAKTGEPLRIALEGFFTGTVSVVSCSAPENALLSQIAGPDTAGKIPGPETGWQTVALYDWTPLSVGSQALPVAILEFTLESGAVRKIASQARTVSVTRGAVSEDSIPVTPSLGKAFDPLPQTPVAKGSVAPPPPPVLPPVLALPLSGIPWQRGNYAKYLEVIREAEYTSLFPGPYRALRLSIEETLGLGNTLPVPPGAWKFWCVIGSVLFLSAGLFLKLIGSRIVLSRTLSSFMVLLSLVLAIGAVYVYTRDLKPCAVVIGGSLLHVPEKNSTVVDTLIEGSTVSVLRSSGPWAYVKTDSARQGWLELNQILVYTQSEK